MDISTSIQGADERHYFEAVAAMWRTVLGAEVGVDESEFKVLLQNRELHRLPLFLDSWIGDFADPVNFLQLFDSRSSLDYGGYHGAAFDSCWIAPLRSPTTPRAMRCSNKPSRH